MRARLIASDIDLRRIICASKLGHYILRQINKYRSRTPCPSDIERLLENPSQVFPVTHGHPVFGNASGNPDDINLLERIVSDQMPCHLAGKAYQRHAVVVGRRKACYQVGCPRPAGYQAYANLSCRARIGICLMYKRDLLSWQDDLGIILLV